jgi:hypothetical protein
VLGIRLHGLDNQVQFVGAVDLSRYAVVLTQCGYVGFGEVMQPVNATCRVIPHEQDGTGAVFHPGEQEQVVGAEVEHRGEDLSAGAEAPAPIGSAVERLPGGLLRRDIATARRMIAAGELLSRRCGRVLGFAEAVAAEKQDFRVFDETINDSSGNGGVEENVAPVRESSIGGDQ